MPDKFRPTYEKKKYPACRVKDYLKNIKRKKIVHSTWKVLPD